MKPLLNFFAVAALLVAFLFTGCATTASGPQVQGDFAARARNFVQKVEPTIRPSAATVCRLVINSAVNAADRAEVKAQLLKVSAVIEASNGASADQLQSSLVAVLPKTDAYNTLATTISGLYQIALPYIKGDAELALKVVSDLAGGCADAARG